MASVLNAISVTKSFGKRKAVNGVSLEIHAGEIVGLLGADRAGKTAFAQLLLGLVRPDAGEIYINGINTQHDFEAAMRAAGGVLDAFEMYNNLTGLQNMNQHRRVRGGIARERVNEVSRLFGLDNYLRAKVRTYSSGMKQRLAMAMAVMGEPRLLVLDDCTEGFELLETLANEHNMGILITGKPDSPLRELCHRVELMEGGKIYA